MDRAITPSLAVHVDKDNFLVKCVTVGRPLDNEILQYKAWLHASDVISPNSCYLVVHVWIALPIKW